LIQADADTYTGRETYIDIIILELNMNAHTYITLSNISISAGLLTSSP
jgi:hypothetical protein